MSRRLLAATFAAATLVSSVSSACTNIDHQACDELCKTDSFWYGHCVAWDGTDFSCRCFEYHWPLSGEACKQKQLECMHKCKQTGKDGGYCFPQSDKGTERHRTSCECFQQLPDLIRRRRRDAVRRRRSYRVAQVLPSA